MAQRLVLRALLADDQHLDLAVPEATPIEHRSEVPAERLAAGRLDAERQVVGQPRRRAGPSAGCAAVRGRARRDVPDPSTTRPRSWSLLVGSSLCERLNWTRAFDRPADTSPCEGPRGCAASTRGVVRRRRWRHHDARSLGRRPAAAVDLARGFPVGRVRRPGSGAPPPASGCACTRRALPGRRPRSRRCRTPAVTGGYDDVCRPSGTYTRSARP
jgi:hypothetical protein